MDPIILNVADGTVFFVGLGIVGLAELLMLHFDRKAFRSISTVAVLVGIVLVGISSTPLPLWMYAMWFVPAMGCLLLGNSVRSPRKQRAIAAGLLLLATAALSWVEARYHRSPRIMVPSGRTVYVLGDSLSAGMGAGERCWPAVLAESKGIPVVNLAEAGATVQSALGQAERIAQPNSVVIVEIGGNDLLGETEAGIFRGRLDSLLRKLRSDQHAVVMFELPLYPFRNAYGRAQREVAAEHGVTLLPKRFLTRVLGLKGGTLDGLHLSEKGHAALAAIVGEVLEKENQR